MAQPLAFMGITITAPGAKDTLYHLIELAQPSYLAFMAAARQVILQGDPGNSTNNVLIGDDNITSSNYGLALTSTTPPVAFRGGADFPFGNVWVLASGGSPKLNITIIP